MYKRQGFTTDLSVGNTVLVDDGLIGMEVTAIEGNKVICKVLNNGDLEMCIRDRL